EIADYVRLLFARTGTLICPSCGERVIAYRTADVVTALQAMPTGSRCAIAFPAAPMDEADQPAWLASLLEEGYVRIQVGSTVYRLGAQSVPNLTANETIWVLLDRVEIGKTPSERLTESVDAAFRRGQGRIGLLADTKETVFD